MVRVTGETRDPLAHDPTGDGVVQLADNTALTALRTIALDVETTGLDPLRDRLLEVGLAVPAGVVAQAVVSDPAWTGAGDAAEVSRIPAELTRNGVPLPAVLGMVRDAIQPGGDAGAVVVGQNIGFDLAFLAAAGGDWVAGVPAVDLVSCGRLVWPGERVRLEDVCARLGVQPGGHRAGADALAEALCWAAMIPLLLKRGVCTWGEMCRTTVPVPLRYPRPPWPARVQRALRHPA